MKKMIWIVLLAVGICPLTLAQRDARRHASGRVASVGPTTATISGQATNAQDGMLLSGGAMTHGLLDPGWAGKTTDANDPYSLTANTGGDQDSIAAKPGFNFTPARISISQLQTDQPSNSTAVPSSPATPVSAGDVLISEFRLDGPNGVSDEFVELYNNTDQPITVASTDGSAGWSVGFAYFCQICGPDPEFPPEKSFTLFTVPNATVIPARGHFLWTNNYTGPSGTGYSLKDYGGPNKAVGDASGNFFNEVDYPDDYFTGLALFTTTNPANWSMARRLDAVGGEYNSTNNVQPLFLEGTGIQQHADFYAVNNVQYSWVRRMETGVPQDTNNSAADFVLISNVGPFTVRNEGFGTTMPAILGAPGPENLSSPVQRNAQVKPSLIDPQQLSTAPPNRERDATPNVCGNPNTCAQGTLTIRRKFKNSTGAPVSRLRFRIVDITTLNTPNPGGAQADLRALDSTDATIPITGGSIFVNGTTVEQPPPQSIGGGLNSTMTVTLTGGALANGASINVQFVLGVQANGRFRFLVNVEALTGAGSSPQKLAGARASK